MNLLDFSGGTELIPYEECRQLLSGERVGRLVIMVDGRPEIFPVNYGLDGDGILFRSNRGRKLTGALLGEVVFEVDRINVEARSGWSIVVHGRAQDISQFDGPSLRVQAELSWTGPKDALVRISLESLTGRRVTAAS
jgi:nitroimidazol reductase NimA-like FMN-containing flavoprotein (pyridoxamine 5'-phosphate oxidase superfamily)